MDLLIDSNVILDYILEREPFFNMAEKVLNLSDNHNNITLNVSASAVTDINYIAYRNLKNQDLVYNLVKKVLSMVKIAAVSEKEIIDAINLNWKDFEDAVQYSVAASNDFDGIVTRNMQGFDNDAVKIFTPEEICQYVEENLKE